ncbi:hypothetical protein DAEQUDRAFT_728816 [Daedalea quercina L-15889]|uniref:Uncharacterized protein n=1 Tax=Daedalea quercina L-15889 TaxID=1314783 RepID=A0A165P034_9APHY|nr:hypothetical protein DAEQUDRAFT_728816 [Daedalea quercina L-15889]
MSSPVSVDGFVKPTPGAILLGSVLSAMFFGLTMIQNRRFYETCWDDSMRLKLFVALIGALNTAQMVTVTDCDWWRHVHNYRLQAASSTGSMVWALALGVGLTASIALMIQSFFALRVWIVCRNNRVITLSIAMLALLQLGKTSIFLQYLRAACEELARTV